MRRIAMVLIVLLTCLTLVGCGSSTDSGESPPDKDVTQGPDTTPALEDGVVRVTLGWAEPVDMDLEVWDADGQTALTSAGNENEDVLDGTKGREYVDFTGDYGEGEYVISVYFAEETHAAHAEHFPLGYY